MFIYSMRKAFIQLHLSILLAGFTGIFGRLITLPEGPLVWYRTLITSVLLVIILKFMRKIRLLPLKDIIRIALVGFVLVMHWIFFYGSIKASNVSVGVVCFSLTGFFTAVFEPALSRRMFSIREILFSSLTVAGIVLIFHFDSQYRLGIILGVISAAICALFMIANKRISKDYRLMELIFYEIAGGFIIWTVFMPLYLHIFPQTVVVPDAMNLLWLLLFCIFCTIIMYMLQISALQKISAFTVNLSYNLEPVYTIILASVIFKENHELNASFYAGLSLILLSVGLQMWNVIRKGV